MDVADLRALPEGSSVDADVCIVGSGPAGLTLASELDDSGLRVILLESGDLERNAWAQSMDEIVSVGEPRVTETDKVRNRGLGGTSATWGGRITTLDEIDFRRREWVPHSGWPIGRPELTRYWARAAGHLGVSVPDPTDPELVGFIASRVAPSTGGALTPYVWAYSTHPSVRPDFLRFGPRALRTPTRDVRCFLNATVTHIDTDDDGRTVRRLEVRSADRRVRWVRARQVVLCAGGIENGRLLLASSRIVRSGVGNAHGCVGRYLMDHRRGPIARFPRGTENRVQRVFGDFLVKASELPAGATLPGASGRTWLTPGYALSPKLQEAEELLNCALFFTCEMADSDPLTAALNLAQRTQPGRNLRRLAQHPVLIGESLVRVLARGRYPIRELSGLYAQCIVEQRPDPDSRITLTDRLDVLGIPVARVDWRVSEQEARTVRRAAQLLAEEMRRGGLPVPEPVEMISAAGEDFQLPEVAHPSGATRMSADPAGGVVDANCAVHGVAGLHIVGSSVFPTNGHANPTQTIVALAVRLADHLKAQPRSALIQADSR